MPDFIATEGYNPVTALGDFTAMMSSLIVVVSGALFWYYRRKGS